MKTVRPKKYLGQHFLNDENIARKIVNAVSDVSEGVSLLEVGPGTGVITKYLIERFKTNFYVIEIDGESRDYLSENFPQLNDRIIGEDFLKTDLSGHMSQKFNVVGNLPYNISSQIFFRVLDHRDSVDEVVAMIQREVAERICSKEGSKIYGIISVLIQAFYNAEVLFDVSPNVFTPKPKVWSSVIRLTRNQENSLKCDEELFRRVVKQAFQTRRKTLRNALKSLALPSSLSEKAIFNKRAEQLSVQEFIDLTTEIQSHAV